MADEITPSLPLRIVRTAAAAKDIRLFELKRDDGGDLPEFTPGSHISLRVPNGLVRKYSLCNDPASGGRMIDNIITNTLLPALSREFLTRSLRKEPIRDAQVGIENGDFAYRWGSGEEAPPAPAETPSQVAAAE